MKSNDGSHHPYRKALKERVLIFDGAMGTNLQAFALTAYDFGGAQFEGCMDILVLTKPEAVEPVHRSFLEVGGMMTHGSVVTREYGIPAAVGVHEATRRLRTGMRVRIDGSSGEIQVLASDGAGEA